MSLIFLFEDRFRLVYKHPLNPDYLIKIFKLIINKWTKRESLLHLKLKFVGFLYTFSP